MLFFYISLFTASTYSFLSTPPYPILNVCTGQESFIHTVNASPAMNYRSKLILSSITKGKPLTAGGGFAHPAGSTRVGSTRAGAASPRVTKTCTMISTQKNVHITKLLVLLPRNDLNSTIVAEGSRQDTRVQPQTTCKAAESHAVRHLEVAPISIVYKERSGLPTMILTPLFETK